MSTTSIQRIFAAALTLMVNPVALAQLPQLQNEWSGFASLEPRIFTERPAFSEQPQRGLSWSAVLNPTWRHESEDGNHRLTLEPFARVDEHDSHRTHADLREASWLYMNGPWSLRAGLSKVFWGVTESRNLVDIINQTDLVEDIDGEAKLGQPMVHLERWTSHGSFGVFLLPGFRERTFAEGTARLRGPLPIARKRVEYESGAGNRRLDVAARWSHAAGAWDLGLSAFHGTSREPRFLPRLQDSGEPVLVPGYDVITQWGADVQYTRGAWLWKGESILRSGHDRSFAAAVAGFEYTLFGVADTAADLGIIAEAQYDDRSVHAPPAIPGEGYFTGVRVALNDPDSTSILAGILVGSNGSGNFTVIEAERRVTDHLYVELQARLFNRIDHSQPILGGFHNDSHITIRLARYF